MAERPVSPRPARRRLSDTVDAVVAGVPAEPFDITDFCGRLARPIELLGGRRVPMTGLLVDGHALSRPTARLNPADERVVDRLAQPIGASDPELR